MAKDKICRPFVGIIAPENKFTVDTIDDLKSRNYLTIGDIVDLNGYYTAGDGAGHKRKIEETDDGSGVQLANELWANIVHNGEVNVSWFGAKGDGVTDDTPSFLKATSFDCYSIKSDKTKKYLINSLIEIENKSLNFMNLVFNSYDSRIVLIGKSSVDGVNIEVMKPRKTFPQSDCGFINLVNTNGTCIKNTSIIYTSKEYSNVTVGIYCSTKAINTKISNCSINVGWDILFNDSGSRTYKNLDFSKESMGYNLSIEDCILGENKINAGDCIEINSPNFKFEDIKIIRVRALKTLSHTVGGSADCIGIGVADAHNVTIEDCYLYNCISSAGAIHLENVTESLILNNVVEYCDFPINISNNINHCLISGNTTLGGKQSLSISGHSDTIQNVNIVQNVFDDADGVSIVLSDCGKNIKIENNIIKKTKNTSLLTVQNNLGDPVLELELIDNVWIASQDCSSIAYVDARTAFLKAKNNTVRGNYNAVAGFHVAMSNTTFGLNEVTFTNKKNTIVYFDRNPNGYFSAKENTMVFDVANGAIYSYKNGNYVNILTMTLSSLNTPYHTTKMQQEGVYEDFIQYMDEKTEYDRLQREAENQPEGVMMLPVLEEPQPSEKLLAFKEKYLG